MLGSVRKIIVIFNLNKKIFVKRTLAIKLDTKIEERAAKNTFAGIVAFIITFLQSILIVPLILSNWGTIKYGHWISLFAGFTLLQTLDLGHQNYIGNEINILHHKSKVELHTVLSSSLLIAWLIGFSEVLITLFIIFSGNLSHFLGLTNAEFELSYALVVLVIMWFIFGSVSGILIRLLVPIGKFYELQWIAIIIKLFQFVALLAVVLMNGSILTAALTYSLVQSILTIFTLIYLKNVVPEYYPWWKKGNFKVGLNNFFKSLVLTINSIVQQLSINGLILFVSNFYQVVQVPVFTTIRTLTNTAGTVTSIIISSVNPDIVKYYSKGEDRKIFLALTTNLFISGLIVNIALVLSLFFIEPLYKIWTGGKLSFNKSLFLFLASGISFANFGIGMVTYFFGVNKLRQFTLINLSRGFTLFFIAFLLTFKFQLSTVGFSVACSEIIASVIFPLYLMNKEYETFLDRDNVLFLLLAIIPPILIFCLAILTFFNQLSILVIAIVLLIIVWIYYYNWQIIDIEIKNRLTEILNKYLKINLG